MMRNNLIALHDICVYHHVEIDFIQSLEDFGLIKTTTQKQLTFLSLDELMKLERYVRLAKDLDINLEGLHAISQLLNQVETMQNEINTLKAELNHYKQFN
ncbi:chaperone modulator CbpM [Pedobacter sp. R20-19]|uniref:chaperone modulator CbpM n=1 Tax=Pedobacter sp. R20-19 TaxID=1270196 RepID=UPI00049359CB|nr:chaperone modulator CbpM [Pedobacter sp. R20-19]